jgi:hypothetical protein
MFDRIGYSERVGVTGVAALDEFGWDRASVVGLLGRVVMPRSRTRGGPSRIPVKLLSYQKGLTMSSLVATGGVSGTAKIRLLTVSLRENGLAQPVFARRRLCLKCLLSGRSLSCSA